MEMVLFVGIQAVGKSEFFKQYFYKTHIRLNLDMLKTRHREKLLLEACIVAKQPLVIDIRIPQLRKGKYILKKQKTHDSRFWAIIFNQT